MTACSKGTDAAKKIPKESAVYIAREVLRLYGVSGLFAGRSLEMILFAQPLQRFSRTHRRASVLLYSSAPRPHTSHCQGGTRLRNHDFHLRVFQALVQAAECKRGLCSAGQPELIETRGSPNPNFGHFSLRPALCPVILFQWNFLWPCL